MNKKTICLLTSINALLWAFSFFYIGFTLKALICSAFASILTVVAYVDFKRKLIPDSAVLTLAALAVPYALFMSGEPLSAHVIGAFVISAPFLALAFATGGMGGGDVKLMAAGGLFLGYKLAFISVLLGSVSGAAVSVFLLIKKKAGPKSEIAFGPFLALGLILALFFGNPLIDFYVSLFF